MNDMLVTMTAETADGPVVVQVVVLPRGYEVRRKDGLHMAGRVRSFQTHNMHLAIQRAADEVRWLLT